MNPVQLVLERLGDYERRDGYYMAFCPAHDDGRERGLSISEGEDGRALLHCFAGCETPEIVAALGLDMSDLFLPSTKGCRNGHKRRRAWQIRCAAGELVAVHHRRDDEDGKHLWWTRPDGSKSLGGMKTAELPLYRSEHVEKWPEDIPVIVVEGEQPADALASVYPAVVGTVTGAEVTPGLEALEVLRGWSVVLWADNDKPGLAHMERIAAVLQGIAGEVRIFEWADAPPKGDAADHPAVMSRGRKGIGELLDAMAATPIWEPKADAEPTTLLNFRTAKEVAEATPQDVPWRVRPFIANGTITEVDGPIKRAGKTTLVSHMVACILDGRPFMGEPTTKTRAVYLTEQSPTSFRKVLERADLTHREDLLILHWHDTIGVEWHDVAQAAADKALEFKAGVLVVDTIGQFAGIKGDGENSAGEAQEAMKPLQEAASKGLAVVVTRHDRKAGGEVGESGRGSTAWGGIADVIMAVRRHKPDARPTVRVIESLSRFDETPDKLIIELTKQGYKSLGDASAFAEREAEETIVELLPTKPENAMKTEDIVDKLKEHEVKRTVANEALAKLTAAGTVLRIGGGKKGDPYRYYKPAPDEEAGEIHSSALKDEAAKERKLEPNDGAPVARDGAQIHSSASPTYIAEERKTEPGWVPVRDPNTGEWHEVRASECLPGVVETANRYPKKGG